MSSYVRRKTDMAPTSTPSVQVRSRFKNTEAGKKAKSSGLVDSPMLSPVERVPGSEMHGNMATYPYDDSVSPTDYGSPKLGKTRSAKQKDIPAPSQPDVPHMLFEDDINDLSVNDEGYFTLQRSGTY